MAKNVYMPKFGAQMIRGEVSRWLKKEGDPVQKGEPIAEIMTEKVTNEIEALVSGVVEKIVVAEGETADVGAVIAIIKDTEDG